MPVGPIDPSMAVTGGDWQVPGLSGADGVDGVLPGGAGAGQPDGAQAAQPTESFGDMLAGQVQQLQGMQNEAAQQSMALAAGEATDPSQVVMAVERARLGMQLASQIRTKLVEAQQDIFHTQV
jgi:flagellar hook-basal body complex protein FliE